MKYEFDYVRIGDVWNRDGESGFTLNWAAFRMGFGQLIFYSKNGRTICETESMSREFINQAVEFWLDNTTYEDK
jgi:hypothetical protein